MTYEGRQQFAALIKRLVKETGSRRAFARSIGVTSSAVIGWEEGRSIPDFDNLVQVSAKAGYSLEELQTMLAGKPVKTIGVNEVLKQIENMPLRELAKVERAVSDRLVAISEASGGK